MGDCSYCDFIGPFVSVEQPVREVHRLFHDATRTVTRAFGPLLEAIREAAEAVDQTKDDYRLVGPEGDSK